MKRTIIKIIFLVIMFIAVNPLWSQSFIGTRLLGSFQDENEVFKFIFTMNQKTVESGFDVYYLASDNDVELPRELELLERAAEQYIINNTNHKLFELYATMFRFDDNSANMYYIWFSDTIRGGVITFGYTWVVNRINPRYYN